jgi:signal transduction histidine kinase
MGVVALLNGTALLLWPGLQASSYFDLARPYLPQLGAILALGGGLLLWAHLRPAVSSRLRLAAHLTAGAAFFLFGTGVSLPQRAWTALAVNLGYSASLALLPWASRRLARLDTASLRTRLSFFLATATSLALILATAVVTAQEQRLAEELALATQRIEGSAIARNVSGYALVGVRQGRDLAFGLLLLVIPVAIAGGILLARRITRPLGDLSAAVGGLTAGNLEVPIGASSRVTEVAGLAAAFREMRDRLAERTRESERLAAELRQRAETLAEIDRRKDEFLAMLSHELRNPLGAIANASYILERQGTADPQTEKAVAIIRRQIQHLIRMVDDLLDVSRITRGKVELRRAPLDLGEVVRNAVETARPLAEAKQQRLQAEPAAEPLPLNGDATRLEQVLSNLLRNAVKFTAPGGLIEVIARRDGNAEALVLVRDDGIGIAPELLPHVFDLFAQGEQPLDRSGAGLGIGLTLVRSLVEMHGGRVYARSGGAERGSELEVRLPLIPPH